MIKDEITSKHFEDLKTGLQLYGRDVVAGLVKIAEAFANGVEALREAQRQK